MSVILAFGNALMPRSYESLAPNGVRFVPIAGEVSHQHLAWPAAVQRPAVSVLCEIARELFAR